MNTPILKWSRKFDACQACGTTSERHHGKGLCTLCHAKSAYEKSLNGRPKGDRPGPAKTGRWSRLFDACTECGKTDSRHHAKGKCRRCSLRESQREKSEARREASKKSIERAMFGSAGQSDFKFKIGDLIRREGLNAMWSPLFIVTRCFRESGQDRCEGIDIRDGQTVREFRVCECKRFGHMEVKLG